MRAHTSGWILAATVLGACGGGATGRAPVGIDPSAQPIGSRWNATLVTPAGLAGALQLQGSGWMAADANNTRVMVEIANATRGGRHPWSVRRGRCGNDQGIVGEASAYQPLEVGADGRAEQTATLKVPTPTAGSYFISVHASPTNLGTIIACGNLAQPVR